MEVIKGLLYTKEHEWIKIQGITGTIGITGYASENMGDITFAEFEEKGKEIEQFKRIGTLESVKAASDIYAPLSGKIVEVNEKTGESPEIINSSPYEEGWLLKIEITGSEDEKDKLMSPEDYENYLKNL